MKLIINADDFGLSKSINSAVIKLAEAGSLTSTTVMVNMPFADEVNYLLQFTKFGIGLHFNLTQGKPISHINQVKSLVDNQGYFYMFDEFRNRCKRGLIKQPEIIFELTAQYENLYKLIGNRLDHLDSHQAVHKYKPVSSAFIEFGRNHKGLGLRSPKHYFITKDKKKVLNPGFKNFPSFKMRRIINEKYFHLLSFHFSKSYFLPDGEMLAISNKKIDTFHDLRNIDTNRYKNLILEIPCHPAVSIHDLPPSKLREKRVQEFELLNSSEFIQILNNYNLINFSALNSKK